MYKVTEFTVSCESESIDGTGSEVVTNIVDNFWWQAGESMFGLQNEISKGKDCSIVYSMVGYKCQTHLPNTFLNLLLLLSKHL